MKIIKKLTKLTNCNSQLTFRENLSWSNLQNNFFKYYNDFYKFPNKLLRIFRKHLTNKFLISKTERIYFVWLNAEAIVFSRNLEWIVIPGYLIIWFTYLQVGNPTSSLYFYILCVAVRFIWAVLLFESAPKFISRNVKNSVEMFGIPGSQNQRR